MERQYVYRITEIVKIVDGDSYWMRVDVGFRGLLLINVRLAGWDCPEARQGSEYEKAQAVKARDVAARFFQHSVNTSRLWIQTEPDPDSFGRWLGTIWFEYIDGSTSVLGDVLGELGLAAKWPTRWRDEFDKGAAA